MVQQVPTVTRQVQKVDTTPKASNADAFAIAFGAPGAAIAGMITTIMVMMISRDPTMAVGTILAVWTVYGTVLAGLLLAAAAQRTAP